MALAVDSEMATNTGFHAGSNPSSPQTFSFNNVAGTLLLLFCGIGDAGAATAASFTSAPTYNGVAMTLEKNQWTGGGTTGGLVAVYSLLSPATGTNTVSMAFNDSHSSGFECVFAGCISFTGNDGTTPVAQSTNGAGTATSPSINLTGCTSGNITVAACGGGTHYSSATLTKSWQSATDDSSASGNGYCTRTASSGSVTHAFTMAGSDSYATVMVEVAAAGAGPAATPTFIASLGRRPVPMIQGPDIDSITRMYQNNG